MLARKAGKVQEAADGTDVPPDGLDKEPDPVGRVESARVISLSLRPVRRESDPCSLCPELGAEGPRHPHAVVGDEDRPSGADLESFRCAFERAFGGLEDQPANRLQASRARLP